jgi:hypothetical protein
MSIRMTVLGLATGVLALVPLRSTDLPEQRLPVEGGSGGAAFTRECGAGKVLTGFRYGANPSLVAIGLVCRPVHADGSLGAATSVDTRVGGTSGEFGQVQCLAGQVVGGAIIYYGTVVEGLQVHCYAWKPSTRRMGDSYASAVRIGRTTTGKPAGASCTASTQPVVAMRGRADRLVDAIGFTCDEP